MQKGSQHKNEPISSLFVVDKNSQPVLQAGSTMTMFEKNKTAKKKTSFPLLPLIFLVVAAGLADLYAAEAPARFPFVYGAMGGDSGPLWIAKEQGFFRKYGLDPQLVFIIAGRAAQAMLSGDTDIGGIAATHVTNAITSGGDITMLLGLETKLDYFLVARPSIKRAEELKGKKIAIGTPSGTASLGAY